MGHLQQAVRKMHRLICCWALAPPSTAPHAVPSSLTETAFSLCRASAAVPPLGLYFCFAAASLPLEMTRCAHARDFFV